MFDIVDTSLSYERALTICSLLKDFSKGKGSSLQLNCNAHTAFCLCRGRTAQCIYSLKVHKMLIIGEKITGEIAMISVTKLLAFEILITIIFFFFFFLAFVKCFPTFCFWITIKQRLAKWGYILSTLVDNSQVLVRQRNKHDFEYNHYFSNIFEVVNHQILISYATHTFIDFN